MMCYALGMSRSAFFVFFTVVACGSAPAQTPHDSGPADDVVVGTPDAGTVDAQDEPEASAPPRADVPAIACNDATADVYVTPALPTMTNTTRGDIFRCAPDATYPLSSVQGLVAAKGLTTTMTSGVSMYRIAFRTWRSNGAAGASTARVYLPSSPRTLPIPVIVAAHPTDGITDSSAPSMDPTSNQDLALPWAGLGYAIIVPDYAGLGNEGVQGYLDNHDQAYSVLDGARALRNFLSAGALSSQVAIIGYSQGGGAALSAQALASSYGAGGDVAAVAVFAPEWPTRWNSFGFLTMLENPGELTIETGISYNVVEVMRTYAYFSNWVGTSDADDAYPSAKRTSFDGAINSLAQVPLGGFLQANALHISDFVDDSFRTSLLACIQNGASDPGCVDPGKSYFAFVTKDAVVPDSSGAPVLYVQGLADYVMPAPAEAACNIAYLASHGVTPQVCVDPAAQHETVVGRNMDFVIPWVQARLANEQAPACTATGVMPPCIP